MDNGEEQRMNNKRRIHQQLLLPGNYLLVGLMLEYTEVNLCAEIKLLALRRYRLLGDRCIGLETIDEFII